MGTQETGDPNSYIMFSCQPVLNEKKVNVLLVDDKADQRLALSALLDSPSLNILTANSGSIALELLKAAPVAVVLMDVRMPGIDGFETAELIRRQISYHVPIIFITGYGPDEIDQDAGYRLGAVDFIFRPINHVALRSKVSVFVELFRRTEEARKQASQTLRQARAAHEARVENKNKDEFLATISHELRTPLTAMSGWLQIIRARMDDKPTVMRGLKILEKNVVIQRRLIEDLLDVSRIISGKLEIRQEPVSFSEIVRNAVQALAPSAAEKSIQLTQRSNDAELIVAGDSIRLQQVVTNLLTNAIKFTNRGGTVEVLLRKDQNMLRLCIKDNGIGIAPAAISGLFRKFSQADETSAKRGGLGLGLAIVKHIVELHSGTICAESDGVGKGATFSLTIPLASEQNPPMTKTHLFTCTKLENVDVLVVEDNPDTREITTIALNSLGCKVRAADSAETALRYLQERMPDVLLSDLGMPEMNGYELIEKIRRDVSLNLPAIALSAYTSSDDISRAFKAGFNSYLAKPIEPEILKSAIHEVLSGKCQKSAI